MNVKAVRMNALKRMEQSAKKRQPELRAKDTLRGHKQNTAQQLLEREEANARRSRMNSLLTQQFIGKYGSKAPTSRINSFIKATVHDFLHAYSDMNTAESMIDQLEGQIREITENMKGEVNKQRADSRQAQARAAQLKAEQIKAQARESSNQGSRRPSSGFNSAQGEIEPSWAVLNAVMAAEAEVKEQKKQRDAHSRAEKYKLELDKQRDFLRANDNRGEADKRAQHELNLKVAAEHEADMQNKAQALLLHKAQERSMREVQIEENKMLRERERKMKIMAEKADMARSRRLAQAEAEAVEAKRERGRLAVEKVKEENEANKRLKVIAQQKQWDYEAKLNKDYEAKLEREEQARVKAFNDRVEALKKFESAGAGLAAQKASDDEKELNKTLAAIEAKYEADAERQRKKDSQRKTDMVKSREFNVTLIERKERLKREEKATDLARRLQQQKELDAETARNEQKKRDKLQKMQDLKSKLDEQVERRHKADFFQKSSGLSHEEIEYNRKIIKKIESDPKLMREVLQRVKPTPAGGMGDFKYG
jgi:hypothetical protein